MITEEMNNKLQARVKELLTIPEVEIEYQSKENEASAKDWILHQALITLMYTPEERLDMWNKKQAMA